MKKLISEYKIMMICDGTENFIQLMLQSMPHQITPKELVDSLDKFFNGLWKAIVRRPGLQMLQICCENLPEYAYDMQRRTIRGDYLKFCRHDEYDGDTCRIICDNLHYEKQQSLDCGAYRIERPKDINLDDIVGLDDTRDELLDSLNYITGKYQFPEGKKISPPCTNYILYGEPGVGKTALIVSLASSCDIPVFFASSAIFSNAAMLNDMFEKAKKNAPAIVVLEEFNSIGKADQPWRLDCVNTLLAQLDGVEEKSKIMVLASTNHIGQIEPALLRPGRFSRLVHVGLPNADARELFVRKFEKKYEISLTDETRKFFVDLTAEKSIAVIKEVMEFALRNSFKSGIENAIDAEKLSDAFDYLIGKNKKEHHKMIGFIR